MKESSLSRLNKQAFRCYTGPSFQQDASYGYFHYHISSGGLTTRESHSWARKRPKREKFSDGASRTHCICCHPIISIRSPPRSIIRKVVIQFSSASSLQVYLGNLAATVTARRPPLASTHSRRGYTRNTTVVHPSTFPRGTSYFARAIQSFIRLFVIFFSKRPGTIATNRRST